MIQRFFLMFAVLASGSLFAADHVLSNYFLVPANDAQLRKIADKFEVHARVAGGFEIYVPRAQKAEFLKLAPTARLVEADVSAAVRALERSHTDSAAGYRTFDEVQAQLRDYVTQYPEIVQLSEYGKSKQGKPLLALKVSDRVIDDENEPEIMLTAATHGDELITVEVMLGTIDKILKGYATDARLRDIVDRHEIYFIPVVNPDGFVNRQRYDNGVDPNRSYPWPEKPSAEPSGAIGPLMKFVADRKIAGSIDFHAFGEMIMYPWAYTDKSVGSDESTFSSVTDAMASHNGYAAGQISKVIYIAKGSSADYYYWKHGTFAVAIEMGSSKVPNPAQIPSILKDNWEPTLIFLEHFENPAAPLALRR